MWASICMMVAMIIKVYEVVEGVDPSAMKKSVGRHKRALEVSGRLGRKMSNRKGRQLHALYMMKRQWLRLGKRSKPL